MDSFKRTEKLTGKPDSQVEADRRFPLSADRAVSQPDPFAPKNIDKSGIERERDSNGRGEFEAQALTGQIHNLTLKRNSKAALFEQDALIVLNEVLLGETLLNDEIDQKSPEILQMIHFKKIQAVRRKRPTGFKPTSPSESLSLEAYSPLNEIAPPEIEVAHKESKIPLKPGASLFQKKNALPLPDLAKKPSVSASAFFNSYDVKRIGPYILTKTLGTGSTSKVKLGVHESTGEKLAIKIIPRESTVEQGHGTKPGFLDRPGNPHKTATFESFLVKEARFLREISILSLLHHPNIATLYGFCTLPSCYILFLEYVEGGPLLNYIMKHGRLKEKLARQFFRQLLSAVAYLHENAIVHRDLKIENILIDSVGNLKIIDFGLSNFFLDCISRGEPKDSPLKLSTFCGSLYYAAPELLHGRPYYGPEIDVWSLGVILFVLTTGKVPFDDAKLPALQEKIKRGHVEYPAYLSENLVYLLRNMLAVGPSTRHSMEQLCHADWIFVAPEESPESAEAIPRAKQRACLPTVPTHVPPRIRMISVSPKIVMGVCFVLGNRYSPLLLHRIYSQVVCDWTRFEHSPFVKLYYLVEEKFTRWQIDFDAQKFIPNYNPRQVPDANRSTGTPFASLGLNRQGRLVPPTVWSFSYFLVEKECLNEHHGGVTAVGWLRSLLPAVLQPLLGGIDRPDSKSSKGTSVTNSRNISLSVEVLYMGALNPHVYLIRPELALSTQSITSKNRLQADIPGFVLYSNPLELRQDLVLALDLLCLSYKAITSGVVFSYQPSLSGADVSEDVTSTRPLEIKCNIVKLYWTNEHALKFVLNSSDHPASTRHKQIFRKLTQEVIKACVFYCNRRLEEITTLPAS